MEKILKRARKKKNHLENFTGELRNNLNGNIPGVSETGNSMTQYLMQTSLRFWRTSNNSKVHLEKDVLN